jgi:nucleotide-binding universal stress UspA family protein
MTTRLFVLLDFSEYSKAELLLAKKWSEWYPMEIVVIHEILEPIPSLANSELRLKMLYDKKNEIGRKWFELMENTLGSFLPIRIEIIQEPLVVYIQKQFSTKGGDVIIMGLKGTGKLKQIFIGSTVNKILDNLNRITVAVPKSLEDFEPKKLLISVHSKFSLNEVAFNFFLSIIPKSIESIIFLSIVNETDDLLDSKMFLEGLKSRVFPDLSTEAMVFYGSDTFEAIRKQFSGNNDAWLMVQKGSRALSDRLLRKFMVNDLVYDGSIPLIILPS